MPGQSLRHDVGGKYSVNVMHRSLREALILALVLLSSLRLFYEKQYFVVFQTSFQNCIFFIVDSARSFTLKTITVRPEGDKFK